MRINRTVRGPAQLILVLLLAAADGPALAQDDGSEGMDLLAEGLDAFEQRGGEAHYALDEGVIVGTAVADTPNSFLCTKRLYADFELELEFKVDEGLNSGVQIRSHAYDEETEVEVSSSNGTVTRRSVPAGRVHGYQVEIDPSDRAWTAGIYDEARRGWLARVDGEDQAAARAAFRQGEWNHMRILAIGPTFRTWLNGVPVAELEDDLTREGFIALQVHGVGDDAALVGAQVRWRNLRLHERR